MIRRLITLILDEAAARKLEKEMQDALDRGTTADKATRNLGVVDRTLQGLRNAALRLGAALAAALSLRAIVNFGRTSVTAAAAAEASWERLAGQLAATGTRFEDVEAQIRSAARAMQDTTTLGDEEFADVLTNLVGVTGDYSASLAEVQTVADLAAAKQMDLASAAKIVSKAMVGETSELKRYGIIVEDGADAMEALRDRFRGMAENEAPTLNGMLKRASNEWGDIKEAIGEAMVEAGGGASVMETLIGTLKAFSLWLTDNRSEIANWGRVVIRTFQAAYESVRFVARMITNSFDIVGSSIALWALGVQRDVGRIVNHVIEGLNYIPGVDIEFRMNHLTPEEWAFAQQELAEGIKNDTLDMQDAVLDLAEAYRDVGVAAVEAATGQERVADPRAARNVASDEVGKRRMRTHTSAMPDMSDEIVRQGQVAAHNMRREIDDVNPFEGLIEQVDFTAAYMREGFRGVGRAIVAQLIDGRAQEQFAAGLAALATGTWPPNPAALAAAGKHFAAAAAFKAIGATVSGALGGGGGGVGGIPRGAIGSSVPGTQQLPGSEVHIYLDQLSPADPRFQRVVLGATQNARERFGGNVRVNVHPAVGLG